MSEGIRIEKRLARMRGTCGHPVSAEFPSRDSDGSKHEGERSYNKDVQASRK